MMGLPIRTCIGCRGKFPKKDLLRFVCNSTGNLRADPTGMLPGRGAYVCLSQPCINAAFKSQKISTLLRVNLPKHAMDGFKQELLDLVNSEKR
ncbi:YlxR family protein [Candidatus Poribacteria bacterium]|nr:YlxR family protein [Candidatus Poribacteria bacterium]